MLDPVARDRQIALTHERKMRRRSRTPSSKHGGLLPRASHRTGHAGPHPALWID